MITITDQPYRYTPIGQKLMVVCTSTNSANSGFRYVYDFGDFTVNVQPNGSGVGMLDLAPLFREEVKLTTLHSRTGIAVTDITNITCTIREGWLIDGLFTISGSGSAVMDSVSLFPAEYEVTDGYKPYSPSHFAINNANCSLLSDRLKTTHQWSRANEFGLSNQNIYIPVHLNDAGLLWSVTANAYINNTLEKFVLKQYDLLNNLLQTDEYVTSTDANKNQYMGVYPYNLSQETPLNADTVYYKFYGVDAVDAQCTRMYIFYLVDDDCRYDNVRLGWSNRRGGYDYFNFNKKSELTYNYDRKQYQKVIGSYNASAFDFNYYDRSLTDRRTNVTKGLMVTSDWINKGEYEFLNSLLSSNDVWIINGSSQIPVSVDSSSFTIKDGQQDGKLYNVSLNLKYSQPQGI